MRTKLHYLLMLLLLAFTAGAYAEEAKLIDYPTSTAGIATSGTTTTGTVKIHMNQDSRNCYTLKNGYSTNGAMNNNHIKLTTDGGFKAGDKITIAGAINNSDASKRATAVLFYSADETTPINIKTFSDFINGRSTNDDPVEETYTLENDYDVLYLGRDGGTNANLVLIKVTRESSGPSQTLTTFVYDSSKQCSETTMVNDGQRITITGKMDVNTGCGNDAFTVEISPSGILRSDGWWAPGGDYGKYCNFYFIPQGTGQVTITFKFLGNDQYAPSQFSRTYNVVSDVSALSYTTTFMDIPIGGMKKLNEISVSPSEAKEVIFDKITYSWTPYPTDGVTPSYNLFTIASDGTITSGTEEYGRGIVTATYVKPNGETLTAQYTARVIPRNQKIYFKYGSDVTFNVENYPNATFVNPLQHSTQFFEFVNYTITSASGTDVITEVGQSKRSNGIATARLKDLEHLVLSKFTQEGTLTITANYKESGVPTSLSYNLTILPTKDNKFVFYPYTNGDDQEDLYNPGRTKVVSGVTMTFGGFVNNFGKGEVSNHKGSVYGTDDRQDEVKKASTDLLAIDDDNVFFTTGTQNPQNEQCINMDHGNMDDRNNATFDYQYSNIPVYGTYYKFEPEDDGILRLNVLQNGIFIDDKDKKQISHLSDETIQVMPAKGMGLKAAYLVDESGQIVEPTSYQSHSTYAHPWHFGYENYREGQVDANGNFIKDDYGFYKYVDDQGEVHYSEELLYNGWTLTPYLTEEECHQLSLMDYLTNDLITSNTTDIFDLRNEMNAAGLTQSVMENITMRTPVHIMRNEKGGYYTLTKSHTEYVYPVKAGKTYFFYVNASKVGISSFEFVSDNSATTTLAIDGADKETNSTDHSKKQNASVTLSRNLIAGQPNSLMLPFSVPSHMVKNVFGENAEVYHFMKVKDNKLHFIKHHHQMIVADEPCIVFPEEGGSEWTFTYVTVDDLRTDYEPIDSYGYSFIGCFEKTTMPKGSYWISANSKATDEEGNPIYVYRTNKEDWMSNTRAFFRNNGNGQMLSVNGIVLEGEDGIITEIENVAVYEEQSSRTRGTYSLDGRKVDNNNLPKGIYVIDGQKVVVK